MIAHLFAQAAPGGAAATDSNTGIIVAAITTLGVILAALIATLGQRTTKRLEAVEAQL